MINYYVNSEIKTLSAPDIKRILGNRSYIVDFTKK